MKKFIGTIKLSREFEVEFGLLLVHLINFRKNCPELRDLESSPKMQPKLSEQKGVFLADY